MKRLFFYLKFFFGRGLNSQHSNPAFPIVAYANFREFQAIFYIIQNFSAWLNSCIYFDHLNSWFQCLRHLFQAIWQFGVYFSHKDCRLFHFIPLVLNFGANKSDTQRTHIRAQQVVETKMLVNHISNLLT